MDSLIAGYHRFRAQSMARRLSPGSPGAEAKIVSGILAQTMVIACCDARVDPQMIFDAAPGEMFVARVIANLVPPYQPDQAYHGTSAAIEYAVRILQVRRIVVMGHKSCEGIRAMLEGTDQAYDFLGNWMKIAADVRAAVIALDLPDEERQRRAEQTSIYASLSHLATFPWLTERVKSGSLTLHGCWYDIDTGEVSLATEAGFIALA